MEPVIIIGGAGFDAAHLILFLLALALAGTAWWLASKSGAKEERLTLDLERATDDLDEAKQRARTLEEVARKAELELAEAKARSAEDERKFAEMAQGVLQRAN
ncbi:MAG TPA: DNA recombination protein RmuC, partial [Hyphomonas atlantica]|nr:DNA recombination protein RmuC [Hyphomonas atlantica]